MPLELHKRLHSLLKKLGFISGYRFRPCGKTRSCICFWVAQRFTAAISGLFLAPALAAEVTLRCGNTFSAACSAMPLEPAPQAALHIVSAARQRRRWGSGEDGVVEPFAVEISDVLQEGYD